MADERVSPDAFAALQARFGQQSKKAQAYYTVMHAARGALGGDDAASAWMERPLDALAGKSPAQAVAEGREQEVLAHARAL
ncbi:antitoxin Xre/MbcA/ParS toxin-binding domain-containing protein [uncultured Massilia sp.]|uniref:antitoxin Xre/MbcA/ParS toxin-binding domain-containing protein n=1 Tax=uncultured Massilia sp. TaxID=169973 RepID=UPI00258F0B56|nr:antitoxin Xre/MbcA/ParS toxin-binding domain-containing protein [uncultured Massilia sp.]